MPTNCASTPGSPAVSTTVGDQTIEAVLVELGRARMSQRALSTRLGWSHGQLQRRLRRDQPVPFTLEELAAVAEVLDVPLTRLVAEPDARARTG